MPIAAKHIRIFHQKTALTDGFIASVGRIRLPIVPQTVKQIYHKFTNQRNWQKGFLKLTKNTLVSLLILTTLLVGTGFIYLFGPFAKKTEAVWRLI